MGYWIRGLLGRWRELLWVWWYMGLGVLGAGRAFPQEAQALRDMGGVGCLLLGAQPCLE